MSKTPSAVDVAGALRVSVGLLVRRLRQMQVPGELTLPEGAALAHLERGGPTTASALARLERISPQSMGATLGALEARGLVERRADPDDGRRVVLSITQVGGKAVRDRRGARTVEIAKALSAEFTSDEVAQLMAVTPLLERLAHSI